MCLEENQKEPFSYSRKIQSITADRLASVCQAPVESELRAESTIADQAGKAGEFGMCPSQRDSDHGHEPWKEA